MSRLFTFSATRRRDPEVARWFNDHNDDLGAIALHWFSVIRNCGGDIGEILHDGHPTSCVENAAFAYVNAFKVHVNLGFFHGAELRDPEGLLEGTGKFMRHVKLAPDREINADALSQLINSAYKDIKRRVENERQ